MLYIRLIRILGIGLSFFLASSLFTLASETNEKPIKTELSGYWTYYCKNYDEQRHCEIARKIDIKDKNETFLIVYKITKDIKSKSRLCSIYSTCHSFFIDERVSLEAIQVFKTV